MNTKLRIGAVAAAIALAAFLSGCDDLGGDSRGESGAATGTWVGSITTDAAIYGITLNLVSTGSVVSGTYSVTGSGVSESGSVNGSIHEGNAVLTLYSEAGERAVISLDVDEDAATGNSVSSIAYLDGPVSVSIP